MKRGIVASRELLEQHLPFRQPNAYFASSLSLRPASVLPILNCDTIWASLSPSWSPSLRLPVAARHSAIVRNTSMCHIRRHAWARQWGELSSICLCTGDRTGRSRRSQTSAPERWLSRSKSAMPQLYVLLQVRDHLKSTNGSRVSREYAEGRAGMSTASRPLGIGRPFEFAGSYSSRSKLRVIYCRVRQGRRVRMSLVIRGMSLHLA